MHRLSFFGGETGPGGEQGVEHEPDSINGRGTQTTQKPATTAPTGREVYNLRAYAQNMHRQGGGAQTPILCLTYSPITTSAGARADAVTNAYAPIAPVSGIQKTLGTSITRNMPELTKSNIAQIYRQLPSNRDASSSQLFTQQKGREARGRPSKTWG